MSAFWSWCSKKRIIIDLTSLQRVRTYFKKFEFVPLTLYILDIEQVAFQMEEQLVRSESLEKNNVNNQCMHVFPWKTLAHIDPCSLQMPHIYKFRRNLLHISALHPPDHNFEGLSFLLIWIYELLASYKTRLNISDSLQTTFIVMREVRLIEVSDEALKWRNALKWWISGNVSPDITTQRTLVIIPTTFEICGFSVYLCQCFSTFLCKGTLFSREKSRSTPPSENVKKI